jgi:hypothetical protein
MCRASPSRHRGSRRRAEPDGHTVSIGNWATQVVNGATFILPYDSLTPDALPSSNPYVVVARNWLGGGAAPGRDHEIHRRPTGRIIAYPESRPAIGCAVTRLTP